jgi:hypothetical protein
MCGSCASASTECPDCLGPCEGTEAAFRGHLFPLLHQFFAEERQMALRDDLQRRSDSSIDHRNAAASSTWASEIKPVTSDTQGTLSQMPSESSTLFRRRDRWTPNVERTFRRSLRIAKPMTL